MTDQDFQSRVQPWLMQCFGAVIANNKQERNHRFLEEALELVQSTGCTQSEAHQLVDYVFSRPVGDPPQEAGGVMVTLAALCLANDMDMLVCGNAELSRVWSKVEAIREKQASKPKHSPLPQLHEGSIRYLSFLYQNWKHDTGVRRVIPIVFWYGSSEWHPEKQWFIKAYDKDKEAVRDFAVADIKLFCEGAQ